ncbi:class E sortase [Bifidobacterium sp. ESL0763]|uniref:class E sortase n=1 Tax=Bifidobacterium sp. ESL0763 TaxID=2983227 RepID=UPI0035A84608
MTMDASADEPGHSIYSSHSDYRPTDGNDVPATKHSAFWKALGIVAELLFTLAAICALYVVWQMWWTGVESEHNQIEQRQSVGWSDPSSAKHGTKVAPAQNGAPPVQPRQASSGDLIAQIYIPRFGNQWQRNIVEGTDMPQLNEHGVGHYTQSQMPGQVGNFAVAGHRNGYGQPFGDVDKLDAKAGDTIIVRTKDYWYVYQYTSYEVVTPDQVRVIAPNPQNPSAAPTQRLITLTTCEPKYSTPTHRWISYGKLKYWAKVSDGIPQELAKQGANGKVQFINNGKTSPVAKLSSLIPLIVALLVIYLVLFIAAAIVWRWPLRKAIRLGEHKKPEPSIYGGLTRLQPGIKPLRVLLVLLLIAVAALALFQWAFPWAAQNIPILHQMSNYVAVQQ